MTSPILRRRWASEPPSETPQPTVFVSSRDRAEVPHVGSAARLARAAKAAGWATHQTYALAEVPATTRCDARRLASVVVRLSRPGSLGWATWRQIDDGAWKFAGAVLNLRCIGARELMTRLTP